MSENVRNLSEINEIVADDRNFVLRIVQLGLAGLMDGSVSTLAPIFATAFCHAQLAHGLSDRSGDCSRRRHLDGLLRRPVR